MYFRLGAEKIFHHRAHREHREKRSKKREKTAFFLLLILKNFCVLCVLCGSKKFAPDLKYTPIFSQLDNLKFSF
jgi:hypothetical protein